MSSPMPSDTPERAALRELVEACEAPRLLMLNYRKILDVTGADTRQIQHFVMAFHNYCVAVDRAEAVLNQPEEASR